MRSETVCLQNTICWWEGQQGGGMRATAFTPCWCGFLVHLLLATLRYRMLDYIGLLYDAAGMFLRSYIWSSFIGSWGTYICFSMSLLLYLVNFPDLVTAPPTLAAIMLLYPAQNNLVLFFTGFHYFAPHYFSSFISYHDPAHHLCCPHTLPSDHLLFS